MEPRTEGYRKQMVYGLNGHPLRMNKFKIQYNDTAAGDETMINEYTMTAEQIILSNFENTRKVRAKRVRNQLLYLRQSAYVIAEIQTKAILVDANTAPRPGPEKPEIPFSPRWHEIIDYLFNNRLELALDTMDFRMPQHTLYDYVMRREEISLSSDEWRDFLEVCSAMKLLFK
jgi:hypothetical protein